MAEKKKTFEENMERLNEIVRTLEKGDANLDEMLKLFEEGTSLAGKCGAMLDKAEQKVVKLSIDESGKAGEEPFEGAE